MHISSKFKCQLRLNWHLNLIEVCTTQSCIFHYLFEQASTRKRKLLILISRKISPEMTLLSYLELEPRAIQGLLFQ
jgi:hypothetical protein